MRPFIILVLSLSFQLLQSQEAKQMGLVLDDPGYREVAEESHLIPLRSGQKYLAPAVDLQPYCPQAKDQGELSSCVGWSAGYAAMTIEQAVLTSNTNREKITDQAFSAMFVYNLLAMDDCQGVRLHQALEVLKSYGNCKARDFDLAVDDCSTPIPSHLIEEAAANKISDYIRLFDPEEKTQIKTLKVKYLLAQKKPVVVGMKVLRNFYQIDAGEDTWIPTIGDQTYAGGHAMVVVGYDDNRFGTDPGISAGMRGGFKVMNSWGSDWGQEGFIWIRYAHFGSFCRHAFAIAMDAEPIANAPSSEVPPAVHQESERTMLGSLQYRSFTGIWDGNQPIFKQQEVALDQWTYSLSNRQVGERFQIALTASSNLNVYFLSIDPSGKAEIHYQHRIDEDSEQSSKQVILPQGDAYQTYKISRSGVDHVIALFSDRQLNPSYLDKLCKGLSGSKNLAQDLQQVLGNHHVPFSEIQYHQEFLGFSVDNPSGGNIISLVLELSAI